MSRPVDAGSRALTPSLTSTPLPALELHDGPGHDYLTPGVLTRQPSRDAGDVEDAAPALSHRLRHSSSILALAIGDDEIFAGTQAGEIVVFGLATYEKKAVIEGHKGPVLALFLSADGRLLFSSAGDRIVNVWHTASLDRACSMYSPFDVGDVFCVVYSAALHTAYMGAQNTTISWCGLGADSQEEHLPVRQAVIHPSLRNDPFFDSAGPGGVRTPRPAEEDVTAKHAVGGRVIEIARENVKHFAHYGYVNCMLLATDGVPEAAGLETLITGGGDGVVKLWRLHGERRGAIEELHALDDGREEGHSILSIAMDGTFLYSGRSGGEVDVWDLETRQLVRNLKAHFDDVLSICISARSLLTAAVTGYVRKFDKHYALKSRFKAHQGRILTSALACRQNRPIYVTGGSDATLAVWDVSDSLAAPSSFSETSNEQLLDSLRRFVSHRTVSSNPAHQMDCRRGASYLRSVFKNFGASTEMLPTKDSHNPVIFACFRGNAATAGQRKRILFYGHYDVVAAENESGKWTTGDPFAMEGVDGYLYGRGVSDNKGPVMAAIFACAELKSEQGLKSDIIFLIEGEEECGSRGFEDAVRAAKDRIGPVDWILLANSYWLDDRVPCLTYGLRGVIHATVAVESSYPDLHSGVDGSSQLDESLKDLVMLLSSLNGKNGEVRIPGFYDPIPPLSAAEGALYTDMTNALVQKNPALGSAENLAESLMRKWRDPSLTIHRFQTSGPDNATIIPRLAKAALSLRLVPNQEVSVVAEALRQYLQSEFRKLDSINALTITIDHQAEPWLGDWTNEIFKCLEEGIIEVWSKATALEESTRRQRRATLNGREKLRVDIPSHSHKPKRPSDAEGYFTKRLSPTTSTVLANGSVSPMTPLGDIGQKLERFAASQVRPGSETAAMGLFGRSNATDPSGPYGEAQQHIHRTKPLYIREGGSIPAIRFLEKEFGAPAAHFPIGQASDSAHLDNERLRLVNLYIGRDVMKKVFSDLPKR